MSIINGLLTGGILIGKICQAVAPSQTSKTYIDKETGLAVTGEVTSGGVTFFRSDVNGKSIVYAYNKGTSSWAGVTIPNESDEDGVMYSLPPTEKLPIGEVDSPLVSPMVNVTTGLTDAPSSLDTEVQKSLVKLAFSNLSIGKTVRVGSFSLSCTTTQLIVVSMVPIGVTAMTYMLFQSNKGVTATNQNPIPPKPPTGGAPEDVEQHFDVDFASLGFDMNVDVIRGQITLEADSPPDELAKLSKVPSEPLHPVEQEFFRLLELGEL